MTVAQLIKELKKYPKDAKVGIRDHDGAEDEISSIPKWVKPFDPETSFDKEFCKGITVVIQC
jgi:hypothetical protein